MLSDGRRLFIYSQRTADDRIALGGRGHPYMFGSRLETRFHDLPVHDRLQGVIAKLFCLRFQLALHPISLRRRDRIGDFRRLILSD